MAYTEIDDPEAHFQCVLYTGDGNDDRNITLPGTTDMQPDIVWVKGRSVDHSQRFYDAARGATKYLNTATNGAEATGADGMQAFQSDGFQIGTDGSHNTNTDTYVAWCWKAGGSGTSNTAGSLNTTKTSANSTAGISVITYTGNGTAGATIGHGMGKTPTFFVQKRLSGSGGMDWHCYHAGNGSNPQNSYLYFNETDGTGENDSASWFLNDTYPSSSLITLGNATGSNGSTINYVIYAFANVKGFSKHGTYEGNGNVNGAFVYTGFRPSMVIIKNIDASDSWRQFDIKRVGYNGDNNYLYPNSTTTESSDNIMDILSNGFKLRKTDDVNASNTYVYLAFADSPLVNSKGAPCNAR